MIHGSNSRMNKELIFCSYLFGFLYAYNGEFLDDSPHNKMMDYQRRIMRMTNQLREANRDQSRVQE